MNEIALGILLRFGQLVIEVSLTLIVGVVVAGVFRRMVGPAGTRHLFGSGFKGLFRGWLAGVLLPVCSLGVIPVAREMRRVGVPGGTVLSFVLAAPLLNPISFLYGLTLADPSTILTFSAFSLILSTAAGFLWDRVFAGSTDGAESADRAARADAEPLPVYGIKRILSVGVTALRELTGRDLIYYGIGIVGSALLAGLIPFASLQNTMKHDDLQSPLVMTLIAVPLFSSPLSGMMKIGLMFDHGNSVGAAFVLFSLGIGVCLGTLVWLTKDFRPARVVPWFCSYVTIILALAYLTQPLLDDPRRERIAHTHAFDDYSNPFSEGMGSPELVLAKWKEKFTPLERPAVYGLAAMLALGFTLRLSRSDERIERWLTTAAAKPDGKASTFDVVVPGYVLAGVTIAGLIAFSVAGAFLYYPDREQCFAEMVSIHADAVLAVKTNRPESGQDKTQEAIRHFERWDLVARKLEVGTYIRSFTLTEAQKKSAYDLREEIEVLRDYLRDGELDAARDALGKLEKAYQACKRAYAAE
jgi:uncharacterized membrane protein YraQ (UPF0718 family)